MKTPVSISRSVPLNCEAIVPLLRDRLEALEEASERGTVVLGTRLPANGRITMPVRVQVTYPAPKAARFRIAIAARTSAALYPRFRGELSLTRAGTAATIVALTGEYSVPLGLLGRALDGTAAHGVAPRGLEDLLERLVADVLAAVASDADFAHRAARSAS